MTGPRAKTERKRRRRAKATLDFASGEVHDRALDAAVGPRAIERAQNDVPADDAASLSPEELSNEDRAQLGVDRRKAPAARVSRISDRAAAE